MKMRMKATASPQRGAETPLGPGMGAPRDGQGSPSPRLGSLAIAVGRFPFPFFREGGLGWWPPLSPTALSARGACAEWRGEHWSSLRLPRADKQGLRLTATPSPVAATGTRTASAPWWSTTWKR